MGDGTVWYIYILFVIRIMENQKNTNKIQHWTNQLHIDYTNYTSSSLKFNHISDMISAKRSIKTIHVSIKKKKKFQCNPKWLSIIPIHTIIQDSFSAHTSSEGSRWIHSHARHPLADGWVRVSERVRERSNVVIRYAEHAYTTLVGTLIVCLCYYVIF